MIVVVLDREIILLARMEKTYLASSKYIYI